MSKKDMKLVIDIPKALYNRILDKCYTDADLNYICGAVTYGTPLPKGHGRLIDADELYLDIQTDEEMRLGEHIEWVKDRFDNALTIIGTDIAKKRKGIPLEENDSGYNCENWIP